MRLDAVALAQCAGKLAQAADALGEHDHLLLAGDPGDRLRGDPTQQRQPIAAAADRRRDQALADECLGERGLGVQQRLGVDAGVDVDADVAEHHALHARELGQRLPVQIAAGFQALEFAQDGEQPPVGLAAAAADRLQ